MSKRNYLNVVSAGVVAFGTLALGLVTVLPVASAANAAHTPSAKEQTSVNGYVKKVNEAKTKADYDKALKNLRDYEAALDLTPAKVKDFKAVTLKDLKDAYDAAKASYDKVAKLDPKFDLATSKLVKTAYDNAKAAYKAALKSPELKEALAKRAEKEGFSLLAKQIRKSNASADALVAMLNAAEKGKGLPETKLEDLGGNANEVKPNKESKETKETKESKSTKETKTRKNHHKFGAPNTGYEF